MPAGSHVAALSRAPQLGNEVAGLQAATRTLEDSAHRLTMAHDGLSKRLGTLQETVGLKSHFLQVEVSRRPRHALARLNRAQTFVPSD